MVPERELAKPRLRCAFCDAIFMTFGRTFGDGLPVQSLPDSCEGRQPVDVEAAPGAEADLKRWLGRPRIRAPAIAPSSNQLQLPTRPGGLKAG